VKAGYELPAETVEQYPSRHHREQGETSGTVDGGGYDHGGDNPANPPAASESIHRLGFASRRDGRESARTAKNPCFMTSPPAGRGPVSRALPAIWDLPDSDGPVREEHATGIILPTGSLSDCLSWSGAGLVASAPSRRPVGPRSRRVGVRGKSPAPTPKLEVVG
jgi:hypothetical protein